MKNGLFLLFSLIELCSYGQWIPAEFNFDTLRYSYRTGGELDSLDYSIGRTSGTQPSGSIEFPSNVPSVDFFTHYQGGMRQAYLKPTKSLIFSALPHIGFSYTFGTQGTQVAQMNYQQIFAKKILVNFNFLNDRGNGFLRNSNYRLNDVDLSVAKTGERWSFVFNATDRNQNAALNGGIQSDQDSNLFPLIFLAVQKSNALSSIRTTSFDWVNYFAIKKDSIRSVGLTSRHKLSIQGRSYSEEDTLYGLYNLINLDPLQTNDAYQLSKTEHGMGVYMRNSRFFATARLDGSYWKYYNRDHDRDTLESAVVLDWKYKAGKWTVGNSNRFNLIGAGNEWQSSLHVKGTYKRLKFHSLLSVEDLWPHQFQRFYFANNYAYNLSSPAKQFKGSWNNSVAYDLSVVKLTFLHQSTLLKDNYYFSVNNGQWSNAVLPSISIHKIGLRADWKYKILTVQPEYSYTYESGLANLIPDHLFKMRVSIKGALFKSKKMIAYLGTELIYFSSSKAMSFLPSMDTYLFNQNGPQNNGMFNLHVFGGFQIDEFRFFVRFENIGYQWTSSSLELVNYYPIPSSQLRVGLTWDFFN